jgi:hypothetical protein
MGTHVSGRLNCTLSTGTLEGIKARKVSLAKTSCARNGLILPSDDVTVDS